MARGKIAQMVEEEAAAAEAEHPDDEDEDEDVDGDEVPSDEAAADPDVESDAEPAEMSIEARAELYETALRLHHDNMAGFFGDEWAEMELCPLCNGVGATAPDAPVLDPSTMRCERCKGHGQLMTEAVNPNNVFRQCPDCVGNGYVPKAETRPIPPQLVTADYFPPSPNQSTAAPTPQPIPPMPVFDAVANVWRDPATGAELAAVAPNGQASAAPAPLPV